MLFNVFLSLMTFSMVQSSIAESNETPLREAAYNSGTVLLNDNVFIKGNINRLKPAYTSTDLVSFVESSKNKPLAPKAGGAIPCFFFAVGGVTIPLNPNSELSPNRSEQTAKVLRYSLCTYFPHTLSRTNLLIRRTH